MEKCPLGEVFVGEVSGRGIFRLGKCPSGKCQLEICPRESASRGTVQSGNSLHTRKSILTNIQAKSQVAIKLICFNNW